jgi:hypothetical protein
MTTPTPPTVQIGSHIQAAQDYYPHELRALTEALVAMRTNLDYEVGRALALTAALEAVLKEGTHTDRADEGGVVRVESPAAKAARKVLTDYAAYKPLTPPA